MTYCQNLECMSRILSRKLSSENSLVLKVNPVVRLYGLWKILKSFFSKGFFVCMSTVLSQNSTNFYTFQWYSIGHFSYYKTRTKRDENTGFKYTTKCDEITVVRWLIYCSQLSWKTQIYIYAISMVQIQPSLPILKFQGDVLEHNLRRDVHGQLSWPGTDNVKLYVLNSWILYENLRVNFEVNTDTT